MSIVTPVAWKLWPPRVERAVPLSGRPLLSAAGPALLIPLDRIIRASSTDRSCHAYDLVLQPLRGDGGKARKVCVRLFHFHSFWPVNLHAWIGVGAWDGVSAAAVMCRRNLTAVMSL